MNESQLTAIVETEVEAALAAGTPVSKYTVRNQIVMANCETTDSDFALACAHHAIGDIVGRIVRKVKQSEDEEPDPQLVLPGYKRLQQRYAVERDGEPCLVRLEMMTRPEVRAKALTLRGFAQGALEHADELDAWADAMQSAAE